MEKETVSGLKIVRHRGRYWWWEGQRSREGYYLLWSLKDTSLGVAAPEDQCRVLEGDEEKRQRDAIAYFQRAGATK